MELRKRSARPPSPIIARASKASDQEETPGTPPTSDTVIGWELSWFRMLTASGLVGSKQSLVMTAVLPD